MDREEGSVTGFLADLTRSFATLAAQNPTVAVMEAAYAHAGLDIRYVSCEVPPERLGDAVRGAIGMGWLGFNCSIPHQVAILDTLTRGCRRRASSARSTA